MASDDTNPRMKHEWKRREGGCKSDHVGDAPAGHVGGSRPDGTVRYERHYTDGCVEIRIVRVVMR
jgi:hypothetical protein